jgi:hypothetical protein
MANRKVSAALIVLCILVGCGRKADKETEICLDQDGQPLRINERLDSIRSHIDSMWVVYHSSIEYLKKKPQGKSYIDEHFQPRASLHYGKIVSIINEVNAIYVDRKLNQDCYDSFTQQFDKLMVRLKNEKKELQELGYKFELHNPYIKQ